VIARTCQRCSSTNLRKNGHTQTGQQKFHCKDCNAYGTLDTKHEQREQRRSLAQQLSTERLSQRAIARTLRMSRRTVAYALKKRANPTSSNHHPLARTPDSRT
jgi:transposase-like protein